MIIGEVFPQVVLQVIPSSAQVILESLLSAWCKPQPILHGTAYLGKEGWVGSLVAKLLWEVSAPVLLAHVVLVPSPGCKGVVSCLGLRRQELTKQEL